MERQSKPRKYFLSILPHTTYIPSCHHVHGIEYEVNGKTKPNQVMPCYMEAYSLSSFGQWCRKWKMHFKNEEDKKEEENKHRAALGTCQRLTRLIEDERNGGKKKCKTKRGKEFRVHLIWKWSMDTMEKRAGRENVSQLVIHKSAL